MSDSAGVQLIVRLNWPWYAAALALLGAGALTLGTGSLPAPWHALLAAAVAGIAFWLLASLVVSHLVYDRSGLARGAWLDGLNLHSVRQVSILHAGQDEASASVTRLLPAALRTVFDFHDPARTGSPSLRRARALAVPRDTSVAPEHLPQADATQDLGLLVFALHELRREAERGALLAELRRTLAPDGRVVVVEHLRDGWNLLAYGPGAFHFLPRDTWLRSFAAAELAVLRETRCTPFVTIFELGHRR